MQKTQVRLTLILLRILPVVVLVVGGVLVAGVHWRFGPVCRLVARLSGNEIWLDSSTVNLGSRQAGTVATESVAISNYSDHPVEIMGANVSCGCTKVVGVPCTIPESGTVRIPIEITITKKQNPLQERATFILNDGGEVKNYLVAIRGEVVAPSGQ